ncbi:MAG: cyclase family protein [Cyclobacteriaceae bacterium]|nr:cyclase family protein [Cyclobacteriaceae bacterium]
MKLTVEHKNKTYWADFTKPMDISIPINHGDQNPNCYYAEPVTFETIRMGNFVGSVREGGTVNYQKISLTPHGNGTHTECAAHIFDLEQQTINNTLKEFHFFCDLVSVSPQKNQLGDSIVTLENLLNHLPEDLNDALIIRTLPNDEDKLTRKYTETNPPYIEATVTEYLVKKGVKHLLIDLPSVDKEVDGGKLLGHKSFWKDGGNKTNLNTITELIFVRNEIPDGLYLLNLQIISLETDASPSKPILYLLEAY